MVAVEPTPADLTQKNPALKKTLLFFTLAALWFVLCRHLSSEWSLNQQYNYGWFVPFLTLYLFWLRWETRPARQVRRKKSEGRSRQFALILGLVALALLFPVRLFEIGNPDWRPLGWMHAAAVATLTLLLLWSTGGKPWLKHFAFPLAFFFVAIPWPTPVEEPIMSGLMRGIASAVTEIITLFGIPAQVEGNVIRISSGLVGVNEACSGVRSLQTSLMIGLLLGELKRLSILHRVTLVGGAIAIALLANFLRTFFLVWIAAIKGVPEVDRWHDIAGYAIVALVFIGSIGLATWLAKNKGRIKKEELRNQSAEAPKPSYLIHTSSLIAIFCWLIAIEVGAHSWYRLHEKNLVAQVRWKVQWPEGAPGFRDIKIGDEARLLLRYDEGRQATWFVPERPGSTATGPLRCTVFSFRWNPGSSSVLRARAHRPDICLPSVGLREIANRGTKDYAVNENTAVPFQHLVFRQIGSGAAVHAFFCLQEDRSPSVAVVETPEDAQIEWSFRGRCRTVRNGVRNLGQQAIECVLVPARELDDASAEQQFADVVRELVVPSLARR